LLIFLSWRGQVYWGATVGGEKFSSSSLTQGASAVNLSKDKKLMVVVGATERKPIIEKLQEKLEVKRAAGEMIKGDETCFCLILEQIDTRCDTL
jgi:hypothetical protein